MAKQFFIVEDSENRQRADKFLSNKLPVYSRAALQKLFDINLIKLESTPLRPGEKVKTGQTIEYDLGPLQEIPEVVPIPIIYEDDNVVVVNKPAGMISHARGKFWQEASVASFIRDKVSKMTGDRAGIVHRLDRATSGVMVCAKNHDTLSFMQNQFRDRKVQKSYIAYTKNTPPHVKAIIDAPISRDLKMPKRFTVSPDGKESQTYYEVLNTGSKFSSIILKPKTGRTHQLRVHLKYINCPIIGDELYGGETADRLCLHARDIEISLPSGVKTMFEAPLPDEFLELEKLNASK